MTPEQIVAILALMADLKLTIDAQNREIARLTALVPTE